MNFNELLTDVQNKLIQDRKELKNKNVNNAYHIELYNEEGTRYFVATRKCQAYSDNRGNYMPFGGGSVWKITYGCVQFKSTVDFGIKTYELCSGKTYGKRNGVEIPRTLNTKKEVMELVKKLEIFL